MSRQGFAAAVAVDGFEYEFNRRFRRRHACDMWREQNARMALSISRTTYVMETGTIVLEGSSAALRESPHVKVAYLGG